MTYTLQMELQEGTRELLEENVDCERQAVLSEGNSLLRTILGSVVKKSFQGVVLSSTLDAVHSRVLQQSADEKADGFSS